MEFTKLPECAQRVAIHPWERATVRQRLEDLGILTEITTEGHLVALLASGEAGKRQEYQIQSVLFRFRGRRGDLIGWLENCWKQ